MKKNHGFSMIELMVVVAIMAVAIGITSYTFGTVLRFRSQACAQGIKSALELSRVAAMSYGGSDLTVSRDAATGEIVVSRSMGTSEKVGKASLEVTYKFRNDTGIYTLGDPSIPAAKALKVEFSSSGSIKDTDPVEWIRISGNKNYKITLYKLTGKAALESE